MISFTKPLTDSVICNGIEYKLNTDYRIWLKLMHDRLEIKELFQDKVAPMTDEVIEQLLYFQSGENYSMNEQGEHAQEAVERLIDFEIDAGLIYAGFMQCYGIDLIDIEYLHWHKFLSLLINMPESAKLSTVVEVRQYNGDDEMYKKLKDKWALPRILTEEEKKACEYFESIWG